MTREELLSIITEAIEDYVCNYVTDTAKAQKMLNAIQTLEQEPCEDAISRCTTCEQQKDGHSAGTEECHLCMWESQYKIKTGHWIKTPKAVMGEGYMWYCDKCEHQVYQDSSRDYPSEKYCPNCGAKMVEPQESDHTCHTCHTCKHYTSGEHDGSCGSYICKGYSDWESEDKE